MRAFLQSSQDSVVASLHTECDVFEPDAAHPLEERTVNLVGTNAVAEPQLESR